MLLCGYWRNPPSYREWSLLRIYVDDLKSYCGRRLESEQQQEGHHETEQTHGLRQGESQDSVREQLLLQRGVAGVADDQGAEHCSDTSTWRSRTKGK